MSRTSASGLKRDSAVRRSLGGAAAVPSWISSGDFDETASNHESPRPHSGTPQLFRSNQSLSPVLRIRVSQLPSLDNLGFALDSYVHPLSDEFLGLRLCDRFRSRQKHYETRKNCPLRVGDVIVTVNQHRLATMHESQAIRYVYNAFRDAGQYMVEFGVYRSPDAIEPSFETKRVWSPSEGIVSSGQPYCPNQRTDVFMSTGTPTDSSFEQHRPMRTSRSPVSARVESFRTVTPASTSLTPNAISYRNTTSSKRLSAIADQVISTDATSSRTSMLPEQSRLSTNTGNLYNSTTSPTSPSPANHRRSFSSHTLKDVNAFNTRAIGRKICIDLVKLTDGGLGFTLTSRDTQTSADTGDPVYVKKILNSGAAIADGRLSVGDRLLSVNGVETSNLHQVSAQLRSVKPGECVKLVISRQLPSTTVENSDHTSSPISKPVAGADPQTYPFRSYTYEFQLPNNVSNEYPPSLGINFKWLTRPPNCDSSFGDIPGLYVDSLVPDGLVLQTGRCSVLPGDRLVGLNGKDLEGLSAKAISQHVKQILAHSLKAVPRTFSLTVHRYREFDQQSTDDTRRSPSRLSNSAVFGDTDNDAFPRSSTRLSLTDSRRRRMSMYRNATEADLRGRELSDDYSNLTERAPDTDSCSYPRYLSVPPRPSGHSCFEREGFGRRSVSEKRHGHVDASQFSFFQTNILPARYKMPEDVDKQYSTMPTARRLKLHRERLALNTSSINSTGPMKALHPSETSSRVQSVSAPESEPTGSSSQGDPSLSALSPSRFHRGRKQNSSFRNAVDRSLTLSFPEKPSVDPHGPSDARTVDRSLNSKYHTSNSPFAVSLHAAPQHPHSPAYLVAAANLAQNPRNSHTLSPSLSRSPIDAESPPVPTRLKLPTTSSKTTRLHFGSFKEFFKRSHNKTTASPAESSGDPSSLMKETPNPSNRRFSISGSVDALKSPSSSKVAITKAEFQTSNHPPRVKPHRFTLTTDEVLFPGYNGAPIESHLTQLISPRNRIKVDSMSKTPDSTAGRTEFCPHSQTAAQSPPPVPPRAHYSDNRQKSLPNQNKLPSTGDTALHLRHRGLSEAYPYDTNECKSSHRSQGSLKAYSHGKFSSYRDHSPVYKPKQPLQTPLAARNDSRANGFGMPHRTNIGMEEGRTAYRHSHSYRASTNPIPSHSQEQNLNSTIQTRDRNHTPNRSYGPTNVVHRDDTKAVSTCKSTAQIQVRAPAFSSSSSNFSPRSAVHASSTPSVIKAKRRLAHSGNTKIYHQIPTTRKFTDFDSRQCEDSTKSSSRKGK